MHRPSTFSRHGFSLLEVLIALAIVSVLVGMALPAFQGMTQDAEETALEQQLQRVRTAVEFYAFQHEQTNPGQDPATASWSAGTLSNQLVLASDIDGYTAAAGTAGFPYGPYLTDGIPENPINELSTVLVVGPGASMNAADDTTGWVFWADTGDFRANCSGNTSDGDPYFEL